MARKKLNTPKAPTKSTSPKKAANRVTSASRKPRAKRAAAGGATQKAPQPAEVRLRQHHLALSAIAEDVRKRLGLATASEAIALLERVAGAVTALPDPGAKLVLLALDGTTRGYQLASTKGSVELRAWFGTEAELVEQAAAATHHTVEAVVKTGTLDRARRLMSAARLASARAADGSAAAPGVPGVAGIADARFQAAYEALVSEGRAIKPSPLARRADGDYRQAVRWLRRFHPKLLIQGAPSEAPVAEATSTTPNAKPVQRTSS